MTTRAHACTDQRAPRGTILDLSFQTTHRFRPFELLAPGFVTVDQGAVAPNGLVRAASGPAAPYASVELRVASPEGSVSAGLATGDDQHVLVRWSAKTSRVSIQVRRAGRTRVLRHRKLRPRGGFGLAFVLCENRVTALVDTGDGWHPELTERAKVADLVDLRREEVLSSHSYAWGGSESRLTSVRAGLFGMTGLRDPHLVQHADGSPYLRDGRVFLTFTCAGLGFFQQAHWAVWSFDPAAPEDIRLEAQLFSRRDGLLLGDHAGQLIREGKRWLVATSSWGDFAPGSIHVRHSSTTDDLLSGVHLLDTTPTPLPTEHGSWDPTLTKVESTWYVGFVESASQDPFDFHPVLATTSADDWTEDLALVAAATDFHQCEGPIFTNVADQTWLVASDWDGQSYPVFDLTGRRIGCLDAPYVSNIPHPQLVPDPAGGWLIVTFDGTQFAEDVMGYGGHGDVVIMHST